MTVDVTKPTFTAEEAEELESMGYLMNEVTALGDSCRTFVIVKLNNASKKENKGPSW